MYSRCSRRSVARRSSSSVQHGRQRTSRVGGRSDCSGSHGQHHRVAVAVAVVRSVRGQ